MRIAPVIATVLAACGSAPCPSIDEGALRAQIRHEVRLELEREQSEGLAREAAEVPLPGERVRVETAAAPSRGAAEPLVTIVMFTDFQCPFCQRVVPTLEELIQRYPDDVRIVFRNNPLPFHVNATPAAEVALEAYDQGGAAMFWQMHDLLFANQRQLERASLERYAAQAGMDLTRLRHALDAETHRARIATDQTHAVAAGARGTPHFFLNGIRLSGAQPVSRFVEIIDDEMRIARRLLEAGVPRGELYARFMRDAQAEPAPEAERRPRPVARPRPDPDAVYRVPLAGRPQLGPDDALVTIVEFSDFQCPFCARAQSTIEQVRQRYGNDVRVVFRHNPLPFHPRAMPAAEAAAEVFAQRGADAFFNYVALLFENQRVLGRDVLLAFARQVGANPAEVGRALTDHRHQAAIREDQRLTQSLGAQGTPTFFVNGRSLRGAQPMAAFEAVIDAELAHARALLAVGTPRAQLYEALTASGHTRPQTVNP